VDAKDERTLSATSSCSSDIVAASTRLCSLVFVTCSATPNVCPLVIDN